MHAYFPEDVIYRVDHWLGLDPLDSLMMVRFGNSTIEPLLNRNYVQSIQITMAEAFDVADRGSLYDKTGAIRDVIQNHMLQVLATVLAEPPDGTGLDSWRAAKSQLIGALMPLTPQRTVKGQYGGYLQVAGVDPKSVTETYAAIRLEADSWRWAGGSSTRSSATWYPCTPTPAPAGVPPRPLTCSPTGKAGRIRHER
jgi:glucose-6-phosphate 1-dehydrogenase